MEINEDPRYLGLHPKDRNRVGLNDVAKHSLRKDWNTPWCKRNGEGLKYVYRNIHGEEPMLAPVKTSQHHFYSEPQSFLVPDPGTIRQEDFNKLLKDQNNNNHFTSDCISQSPVESRQSSILQQLLNEPLNNFSEDNQNTIERPQEFHERKSEDLDESEPPELEVVKNIISCPQNLLENMEAYKEVTSYEPSADELIQVLKNLENLAATNPSLYMLLVDQINGNISRKSFSSQEMPSNNTGSCLSSIAEYIVEEPCEQDIEDILNPNKESLEAFSETTEISFSSNTQDEVDEQLLQISKAAEQMSKPVEQMYKPVEKMSEPVEKSFNPVEQVSKAVEQTSKGVEQMSEPVEQMSKTIEQIPENVVYRKKELPKTFTVIAGSQHRASWPIAPSNKGTTVFRNVELIIGSTEKESFSNHKEVSQKAGLKPVHGESAFYSAILEDCPWAGSLNPVSSVFNSKSDECQTVPWAGSLKSVKEAIKMEKKEKKSDKQEDISWMGTLKHVKLDGKSSKNYTKPQFKRYPDEDAPNPYQSLGGKDARPAYPLTPAARVSTNSEDNYICDVDNESVERIRNNLRETRLASNALLKALLPKLLKEHKSKTEPLSYDESQQIMKEILGMQMRLESEKKDAYQESYRQTPNTEPSENESLLKRRNSKKIKKKKRSPKKQLKLNLETSVMA